MQDDDARPDHTCPYCGGRTIWITRAGHRDVEGCPRCTQVGQLDADQLLWLPGDVDVDGEKEKAE
jgi:hypothetical protein